MAGDAYCPLPALNEQANDAADEVVNSGASTAWSP